MTGWWGLPPLGPLLHASERGYPDRSRKVHWSEESRHGVPEASGFTRLVVNPVISRLRTGGVDQLRVTVRRTGRPRHVPVIPVQVGQRRYLVSPYGGTDWVRNLRAAGRRELHGHGGHESFVAHEVPVAQRIEVIDAYPLHSPGFGGAANRGMRVRLVVIGGRLRPNRENTFE
jgi:deazaflavin-dependent oxidoreductase (nitroreductase family)